MPRHLPNASALLLLALAALIGACRSERSTPEASTREVYTPYHDIPGATFVGMETCRSCHSEEYEDWLLSDHHKAMNPPTEEFVLGDFDDAEFEHFGQHFRFFRQGDEYWIRAQDEEGEYRDMKVEYTFGHEPLQQYLIAFDGGRLQALQVCWDSRPVEEGGQRWYHLYPDEPVPHDDLLHWTRRHFNWNYMCADCHSTNLEKNFDLETLEYHTTWSEMNVSCEACHGPGSEHVRWAEALAKVESGVAAPEDFSELRDYLDSKGLVVLLKEPEEAFWTINPETGHPVRSVPLASEVQLETCAPCHSHRQLLEPALTHGTPYFDSHLPSIINDRLYHHDGQIMEEVFDYGSWVQSRMYHAGVRCTDCHNPHSMQLKLPGNSLCLQCHQAVPYDTPAHHFHPIGSTGASCVECHMPHTTYMVVDDRRDHSLRVPRPDLAKKLGSPDACTQCHTDQTQDWATDHFLQWWGPGPRNAHYGEILAAARRYEPGSLERLAALAADLERPGIVRAAAVETMSRQSPGPEQTATVLRSLEDPDPAVRTQGLVALGDFSPEQRLAAAPLLADPRRAVRAAAARALAAVADRLDESARADFDLASEDFFAKQAAISDRGAGHLELALYHTDRGDLEAAEAAYRDAARVEPEFVPARVNYAELLYRQNRPREAEEAFRAAASDAAAVPENEGVARDALARFLIRMKRYEEGVAELARAVELAPGNAEIQYFYGVALNSLDRFPEALPHLQKARELAPRHLDYLLALATVCRDAGERELALRYAREALALQPDNPQLRQLVQSLGEG